MAIVRLGDGKQLSGKLGGVVYSHNRFGPYVRSRAVPVNPSTSRQDEVRGFVTDLATRWLNTLTPEQRAAWEVYAANVKVTNRMGEAQYLTAGMWYSGVNVARLIGGLTRVDDAPTILTTGEQPTTPVMTASAATQLLSLAFTNTDEWAGEDGGALTVYMGLPQPQSKTFFKGPYRYAGKVTGNDSPLPTSPQTFAAPFVFAENQRINWQVRALRADGRYATLVRGNFLASA